MRQATFVALAVLGVAFVILPSTNAAVCYDGICDTIRCANDQTEENCAAQGLKYVADGGYCKCCPACVKIIKTGDFCVSLRGVVQKAVCEDGAVCKNNVCVSKDTLKSSESAE